MKKTFASLVVFALLAWAGLVQAAGYERRDVTFPSQGLDCAAWYYVPTGLKTGELRPVIVMAHGYSGVKEAYLDNFASKFAYAGFVALEGTLAVMPQPEAYEFFMGVGKIAPRWQNRVTVESLETGMYYDPTAFIQLISPVPLLMIIASDEIITPTAVEKKAFERYLMAR
jgi:fermentation-respiration switch protein FrsA (DUF1100 family)